MAAKKTAAAGGEISWRWEFTREKMDVSWWKIKSRPLVWSMYDPLKFVYNPLKVISWKTGREGREKPEFLTTENGGHGDR